MSPQVSPYRPNRSNLKIEIARKLGLGVEEIGFDELQGICTSAGDDLSLAIGLAGLLTALVFHNKYREGARIASDCSRLVAMPGS